MSPQGGAQDAQGPAKSRKHRGGAPPFAPSSPQRAIYAFRFAHAYARQQNEYFFWSTFLLVGWAVGALAKWPVPGSGGLIALFGLVALASTSRTHFEVDVRQRVLRKWSGALGYPVFRSEVDLKRFGAPHVSITITARAEDGDTYEISTATLRTGSKRIDVASGRHEVRAQGSQVAACLDIPIMEINGSPGPLGASI